MLELLYASHSFSHVEEQMSKGCVVVPLVKTCMLSLHARKKCASCNTVYWFCSRLGGYCWLYQKVSQRYHPSGGLALMGLVVVCCSSRSGWKTAAGHEDYVVFGVRAGQKALLPHCCGSLEHHLSTSEAKFCVTRAAIHALAHPVSASTRYRAGARQQGPGLQSVLCVLETMFTEGVVQF